MTTDRDEIYRLAQQAIDLAIRIEQLGGPEAVDLIKIMQHASPRQVKDIVIPHLREHAARLDREAKAAEATSAARQHWAPPQTINTANLIFFTWALIAAMWVLL